jgi:hypothetical protein
VNTGAGAIVRVTDTTIRDNAFGLNLVNGARATVTRTMISGNTNYGVIALGLVASTTIADIADSTMDGNGYGVFVRSAIASAVVKVSVHNSRIVQNTSFGMNVQSDFGTAATLSVSNSMVSNNYDGILISTAGSKVWASGNTVSDNTNGLFNVLSAGVFESAGNNAVRNNGVDSGGTIAAIGTN